MTTIITILIVLFLAYAALQIALGICEVIYGLLLLVAAGAFQIVILLLEAYNYAWKSVS